MARYELLMPKMGESVAEATVIKWLKEPGETVEADEAILEIATDKVDSEVPTPVAGKLLEQCFKENDVVQVGTVIAVLETEGEESDSEEQEDEAASVGEEEEVDKGEDADDISGQDNEGTASEAEVPGLEQLKDTAGGAGAAGIASRGGSGRFYSPLVRSIAENEGISQEELDAIAGSGAEGRVTKNDVLAFLEERKAGGSGRKAGGPASAGAASGIAPPDVTVGPGDEIIEMDRMRRLIADHMVMSKQVSPHVTSFVEADVTHLVRWREKVKSDFEKREGEKLTYTPLFIEAVTRAIRDFPMVNISVKGTQIIKRKHINIGMAAALPSGNLIVPVIRDADQMSLVGLSKTVNDLAARARNNELLPDEVKEGTFTVTNVGTFGNIMGTPIINQPQAAVLALGMIRKKPAVLETPDGDVIAVRHMLFLSLSYDHRVIDGALGGSFLRRIADYLEDIDQNRKV